MITSTSNQQIKYLQKLQNKSRFRKEEQTFIAEGKKLVEEAWHLGRVKKLYLSESYFNEHASELSVYGQALWKNNGADMIDDKVFLEVSDTKAPQGIMAAVAMPVYTLDFILEKGKKKPLYLVLLEDLRDPGNLGTIMRTAEGSGADAVILSRNCVDLFNPKTVRATMGSIFRVPFFYADDLPETLVFLQKNGVRISAAHLTGNRWYDEEDYQGHTGILIGNEANGISEKAAELCDMRIKIPMEGKLESLNASAAAAVLMYEVSRQRRKERADR